MSVVLSASDRQTLQKFVNLSKTLQGMRIVKDLLSANTITYRFNWQMGVRTNDRIANLDEEALMSFLLKCRLVIQNGEATSLSNIAKIFAKLENDDPLARAFFRARTQLDLFLTAHVGVEVEPGIPVTYGEVMHTFLYGHYAHASGAKESRFERWADNELQFPYIKVLFLCTLQQVLRAVVAMADLSVQLLAKAGI